MPPTYFRTPRRVPTAHGKRMSRRRTVRRRPMRRTYRRRPVRKSLPTLLRARRWMVVKNPFSLATTNPKYPDNRCTFSAGQRLQVANDFQQGSGNVMGFILYPGVKNSLAIFEDVDNLGTSASALPAYENHCNIVSDGATISETSIEKWRQVSLGLRLSLITNTEENDGWFEYIRVPVDASRNKWNIYPDTNATPGIQPTITHAGELFGGNFVDHVTYQSGKLRDIHRYMFTAHPTGEDHEFRNVAQSYPYDSGNNELFQNSGVRDFIDTSYSCVVIKVHGNSSTTKLLYHVVSNQELIYDQNSELSRFHTRSYEV